MPSGSVCGAGGPITWANVYDGESFDNRLFDRNWTDPSTELNLPAGTTLTLAHAEQMRCPNGTLALVNCTGGDVDYPFGQADLRKSAQQDIYTTDGTGNESFRPYLSYYGFQFVSLRGWPNTALPLTLATMSAAIVHSDNKRTASLSFPTTTAGGQLLTKIKYDASVRSLLSNHHSVEEDCPTRERAGRATRKPPQRARSRLSVWPVSTQSGCRTYKMHKTAHHFVQRRRCMHLCRRPRCAAPSV